MNEFLQISIAVLAIGFFSILAAFAWTASHLKDHEACQEEDEDDNV